MKKVTRQLVNRGAGHFKKIIDIHEETPRSEEKKKEKNNKIETEPDIFTTNLDMNVFRPIDNPGERNYIKEWKNITDSKTIFISFVSDPIDSDFYSAKIPGLVQKLSEFGYDYLIRQYPKDRNYHQNCCFKPAFINSIMEEFDKNLVWIDADTILKKSLPLFSGETDEFDIGLVSHNGSIDGFFASPLLLKNTKITKKLIESWDNHCTDKIKNGICELDHDALKHSILPQFKEKIRIKLFSNEYNQGDVLENVNSKVPLKNQVHIYMNKINAARPFTYTNNDFKII
jgi:hypothetical protein